MRGLRCSRPVTPCCRASSSRRAHDVFVTPGKLRSVEDTRKKLRVFLTDVITSNVVQREAALELHAMLGTYSREEALALITEAL